jgi:hypothetical protein
MNGGAENGGENDANNDARAHVRVGRKRVEHSARFCTTSAAFAGKKKLTGTVRLAATSYGRLSRTAAAPTCKTDPLNPVSEERTEP